MPPPPASASIVQPAVLPVVLGPTAVGKSRVAREIAIRTGREILVADSRQVYRRLEIATNKPLPEDRRLVRHHGLDLADPDGSFNVHQWLEAARAVLDAVPRVVLEGGTNLYVDALLDGLSLTGVAPRPERRAELAGQSTEALAALARELDPSLVLDFKNRVRLVRAIEVLETAGPPLSRLRSRTPSGRPALRIGLALPIEALEARIRARSISQIARGLIEETQAALKAGVPPGSQALTGTGYAEAVACIEGKVAQSELVDLMTRNNRRLAKRQMTWLKRDERIRWFAAEPDPVPAILSYLEEQPA